MKFRKNKKGFTIVELVIVIGVIGILSAILIPTFVNLTDNANKAAAKQEVADAYTMYLVEANDQVFDEYYGKKGEGDSAVYQQIKIEYLTNDKVALKRKDQFFIYGEEGWVVTEDSFSTPVASEPAGFSGIYTKGAIDYEEVVGATLATISTFNNVTVYVKN